MSDFLMLETRGGRRAISADDTADACARLTPADRVALECLHGDLGVDPGIVAAGVLGAPFVGVRLADDCLGFALAHVLQPHLPLDRPSPGHNVLLGRVDRVLTVQTLTNLFDALIGWHAEVQAPLAAALGLPDRKVRADLLDSTRLRGRDYPLRVFLAGR